MEDILSLEAKLKGYEVQTDKSAQNRFLKSIIANNNKQAENILSSEAFESYINEYSSSGLPLDYSRSEFIADLNKVLAELEPADRQEVLQQLNIKITEESFSGFVKPNELKIDKFSPDTQSKVAKIAEIANKFVYGNSVKCDDTEIKTILDDLVQGFPEFVSIVGKRNSVSNNTLDIHILKVLNKAIKDPDYSSFLSDADKTVLQFSILLAEFGKQEGIIDNGETERQSAIYANSILDKFTLSQEIKERIINIIRHYNFNTEDPKAFGLYFRTAGDVTVAKIIAKSKYETKFDGNSSVNSYFTYFKSNPMLVHKNPLAAKKYPKITRTINGKTYEISLLDCSTFSPDTDMFQYGYPKGTKLKDITVQVHNAEPSKICRLIQLCDNPNFDITLSTSLRKIMSSENGYGKFGIILSTTKMNRGGGSYYHKLHGITNKGFEKFFEPNKCGGAPEAPFVKISEGIDSFTALAIDRYFATLNYPSQIKAQVINGKEYSKEELIQIWNKVNEDITNSHINEIYALNPKVEQIIIHKAISTEEIPVELIKMSYEYDIPIIIMPEMRK